MKIFSIVLLAFAVAAPAAVAQTHPDLSGTWTLDAAKSDPLPPAPRTTGGRGGRGGAGLPPNELRIVQTPTDIAFTRGTQTITYHFDGTETFAFQQGETRSTVAWDGDRFVISWKKEFYAGPTEGYVNSTGKNVYSLAGTVLTEQNTTTSPKGTTTSKAVFNKS